MTSGTVQGKMNMSCGCAVWNHRDGFRGGVRGVIEDLYIHYGSEPTQALRTNSKGIRLFVDFQA